MTLNSCRKGKKDARRLAPQAPRIAVEKRLDRLAGCLCGLLDAAPDR